MKIVKFKDRGLFFVFFFIISIIVLDRVSKEVVWMKYRDLVVWNSGITLGFLTPDSILSKLLLQLIIIVAVTCFVFWLSGEFRKKVRNYLVILPLGMVVAGGVSNLFDRIFWGSVLDFIPFFTLWTFNVADFSISAGVVLLVLGKLFYGTKNT